MDGCAFVQVGATPSSKAVFLLGKSLFFFVGNVLRMSLVVCGGGGGGGGDSRAAGPLPDVLPTLTERLLDHAAAVHTTPPLFAGATRDSTNER